MYPYDFYDNSGLGINGASDLAWLMFLESGAPGYYMLYNDLENPPDGGDKAFE